MSGPAIVTFLEVAGTAMAAKTMLEGIKEGSMTKAVLGGIGAAMGVSALGTAAATAQGAEAAAAEAAGGAAGAVGAGGTEAVAAETLGGNLAADATGRTVAEQVAAAGGSAPSTTVAGNVGTAAATEPSFLDTIGKAWSGAGDKTKSSLIELGGGLLKGYADEEMLKEMAAEKERLEAESRARRGYSAGGGIISSNRYNPTTHRWEPV